MTSRAEIWLWAVATAVGSVACAKDRRLDEAIIEEVRVEALRPENGEAAPVVACQLTMSAPDQRTWTTHWDPSGTGEAPSRATSSHWANEPERQALSSSGANIPLDVVCGSREGTPLGLTIAAFGSTEQDVPLGPGKYRVVPRSAEGNAANPGEFIVNMGYGAGMFDATEGTLEVTRFDMRGVSGSFGFDGTEILTGRRRVHLEGSFELPCRGGVLEGACQTSPTAR